MSGSIAAALLGYDMGLAGLTHYDPAAVYKDYLLRLVSANADEDREAVLSAEQGRLRKADLEAVGVYQIDAA